MPNYIKFKNDRCPYAFNLCGAGEDRCLPILAKDLTSYRIEAMSRAKHCHYLGIELTVNEYQNKEMSLDKAEKNHLNFDKDGKFYK
jgi:hypothetical protein